MMSYFFDIFNNSVVLLSSEFGILIFIVVYIFAVVLFLPVSWLSLLAGYLYGQYLGSLIVFIAAFLGASIAFYISKKYFFVRIEKLIKSFPKLSVLENIVNKGGLKLIIFTRLSPIFPFSMLNYFYGINDVNYKDFSLSLLCILPGTYLYCSLGTLANDISELNSLKGNNNLLITAISISSTALIVFLLAKYANEFIEETKDI